MFKIHSGDDLYHVYAVECEAIVGVLNSSLEGATELKFVPFYSLKSTAMATFTMCVQLNAQQVF